jgi:DNA primase
VPGFDIEQWARDNLSHVAESTADELMADCPWCGKAEHFYINIKTGDHICFKCNARGRGVIGVFAQVEGLTFLEAQRVLFKRVVQFKRRKSTPENLTERVTALRPGQSEIEAKPLVDFELPPEYIPIWDGRRWLMPTYLRERGVTRRMAKFWRLGFCETGRYASRIVIPIECPNGRSFTARDATGFKKPPYLNPPNSEHGRLLFGWDAAGTEGDVALVEGPFDVMGLWRWGIRSVGIFGKSLHPEQLNLLFRWPSDRTVFVMTDPDADAEAIKIARALLARFQRIYLPAPMPAGVDPWDSSEVQARRSIYDAVRFQGGRTNLVKIFLGRSRARMGRKSGKF